MSAIHPHTYYKVQHTQHTRMHTHTRAHTHTHTNHTIAYLPAAAHKDMLDREVVSVCAGGPHALAQNIVHESDPTTSYYVTYRIDLKQTVPSCDSGNYHIIRTPGVALIKLLMGHPTSGFIQYIAITLISLISCALKVELWVHTTDVQSHQCAYSSLLQLFPVLHNAFYGWRV